MLEVRPQGMRDGDLAPQQLRAFIEDAFGTNGIRL
jgi:hypothetical protein